MKIFLVFALVAAAFFGYGKWTKLQNAKQVAAATRLVGPLRAGTTVTVYDTPNNRAGFHIAERLKMRGVTVKSAKVTTIQDLKQIGAYNKMVSRGIASTTRVELPIIGFENGEGLGLTQITELLDKTPVTDPHVGRKPPYVVVYGLNGCRFTKIAMDELRAKNIPFDFLEINSNPSYIPVALAHMKDSGFAADKFDTPVIEVNGYARPRLTVQEVESRLK